jgi:tRNA pseudouridine65 synthase
MRLFGFTLTHESSMRAPRILYEDDTLLAVDKPAGMLVHRGWGKDGEVLVDWVRPYVRSSKVHTIHRLDRPTSGVVLFAQHPEAARQLGALFAERHIQKHYLALVRGIAPDMAYIDHPVAPEPKSRLRIPAQTSYRRIAEAHDTEPRECSLIEVCPHTGRVHQIRRHLARKDHPLIGDSNYGKGPINRGFKANYGLPRLGLHAMMLRFIHPATQEPMRIVAPMDEELGASLERMGYDPEVWQQLEREGDGAWLDEIERPPAVQEEE